MIFGIRFGEDFSEAGKGPSNLSAQKFSKLKPEAYDKHQTETRND